MATDPKLLTIMVREATQMARDDGYAIDLWTVDEMTDSHMGWDHISNHFTRDEVRNEVVNQKMGADL